MCKRDSSSSAATHTLAPRHYGAARAPATRRATHAAVWLAALLTFAGGAPPAGSAPAFAGPPDEADAVAQAYAHLEAHRADWHIEAPRDELKLQRYTPVFVAREFCCYAVVFDQWNDGVPVLQHGILLRYGPDRRLQFVRASYVAGLDRLPKMPAVSVADAAAIARRAATGCDASDCGGATVDVRLGILVGARAADARLVYTCTLAHWRYDIDAQSGAIIASASTRQYTQPTKR